MIEIKNEHLAAAQRPADLTDAAIDALVELAATLGGGNPVEAYTLLLSAVAAFAARSSDPTGLLAGAVAELADHFGEQWRSLTSMAKGDQ